MELHRHRAEPRRECVHPRGVRQLSPVAAAGKPLTRVEAHRQRGVNRVETLAEAATILFGMAAFYAVIWMLAAVMR